MLDGDIRVTRHHHCAGGNPEALAGVVLVVITITRDSNSVVEIVKLVGELEG